LEKPFKKRIPLKTKRIIKKVAKELKDAMLSVELKRERDIIGSITWDLFTNMLVTCF